MYDIFKCYRQLFKPLIFFKHTKLCSEIVDNQKAWEIERGKWCTWSRRSYVAGTQAFWGKRSQVAETEIWKDTSQSAILRPGYCGLQLDVSFWRKISRGPSVLICPRMLPHTCQGSELDFIPAASLTALWSYSPCTSAHLKYEQKSACVFFLYYIFSYLPWDLKGFFYLQHEVWVRDINYLSWFVKMQAGESSVRGNCSEKDHQLDKTSTSDRSKMVQTCLPCPSDSRWHSKTIAEVNRGRSGWRMENSGWTFRWRILLLPLSKGQGRPRGLSVQNLVNCWESCPFCTNVVHLKILSGAGYAVLPKTSPGQWTVLRSAFLF